MRFRATWATLLTVIMLSLSCAASACETRCDLGAIAPTCHSHSPHNHAQPMAGMDNPAPSQTVAQTDVASPTHQDLLSAPPACPHQACAQHPALLTDETSATAHALGVQTIAATDAQTIPAPPGRWLPGRWLPGRGSPHLPGSSPVARHTTLRL